MAREEEEGETYLARMAPTIQHNIIAHTKLYSYHKTNTHHVAYHSDSDPHDIQIQIQIQIQIKILWIPKSAVSVTWVAAPRGNLDPA